MGGSKVVQISRRIHEQQFCTNNTLVRTNENTQPNLRNQIFDSDVGCVERIGRRNGATLHNFTARMMLGNAGGTALWRGIHVPSIFLPSSPFSVPTLFLFATVQNIPAPTPTCRCGAAGGIRTVIKLITPASKTSPGHLVKYCSDQYQKPETFF